MEKILKFLTAFDWVVSVATVAYGAFTANWWILGFGLLGLVLAWVSPAKRLQKKLANSSLANRRRAKEAAAAQAAIDAAAATETYEPELMKSEVPANYQQVFSGYGALRLHPSKHNRLAPSSFNLYQTNTSGIN